MLTHSGRKLPQRAAIAAIVFVGLLGLALNCAAQSIRDLQASEPPIMLKAMGSFIVGGDTVEQSGAKLSSIFGSPPDKSGHITINQMYVQYMIPMASTGPPMVLLHGATLTGKTYETTPDGRMGWEEYFLRHGHAVYVPDQASRGRSGVDIATYNEVRVGLRPPSDLPNAFRQSNEVNWQVFRFGPKPGTPFPDELFPVAAVDELAKQAVPDFNATLPNPNPTYKSLARLATDLKGAVLMGHSESGAFPLETALTSIEGIRGLILVEPGRCGAPSYTESQIASLATVPILIVFGDHLGVDTGMPHFSWNDAFKSCVAFIEQINKANGKARMMHLPALGIHGNSHMLMMDRNNLQVADLIIKWMDSNALLH